MAKRPQPFPVARTATRPNVGRGALLAACAGLSCGVFPAFAQTTANSQPAAAQPLSINPASLDGRSFGGMVLPLPARQGALSFSSRRAYAWKEGNTQRLLLTQEVRITIDTVEFRAQRAVVWLERTRVTPEGLDEYQVYLYLDKATPRPDVAFDAPAAIQMVGERLPVRGVIAVQGGPSMAVDDVIDGAPVAGSEDADLVRAGEAQLAASLRRLIPGYVEEVEDPFGKLPTAAPQQPLAVQAGSDMNPPPPFDPVSEASRIFKDSPLTNSPDPIFAKSGIITLAAGKLTLVTGKDEQTAMATDGVVLEYTDLRQGVPRTLQVRAQRAVLFLSVKQSDLSRFSAKDVRGFYLEGDAVATDGQYTLRGPKMYYDVARNKAVVLDAVFWTYDERRQLPLYVRAKAIRQESTDQFKAESAKFTNSSFFEPEFSIGATSVTIARKTAEPTEEERLAGETGKQTTEVDAKNITMQGLGLPFLYVPRFVGDPTRLPLRDIRLDNQEGSGTTLRTRWAMYELLGIKPPDNTNLDLLADISTERGVGLGTNLEWDRPNNKGMVNAYALLDDRGTDVLKSGTRIEQDGEFRGIVTAEDRWKLNNQWTAFIEGSYIGDETFVEALMPRVAAERREFTNRLLLRRREENTTLFVEGSDTFNDFLANEYLLTSKGYSVSKLPEARYIRQADDLLPSRPGLITYWSEYRAGQMALNFDEIISSDRGLTTDARAQRALGINANQSPADRLRAAGLNEEGVFRADTRQELTAQIPIGAVNFQPFAIGRVTMYDSDFAGYVPNAGEGNEDARLWAGVGGRLSTSVQRVWDGVDSRLLDLHRIRHIVEPGVTYMVAGTNVESSSLPVYDDEVENLVDGQMVRLGLDQTWQTQRGGPGRWHSVDVFKLKTEVVLSSDDAPTKGPIGHWNEARPELSWAGNFLNVEGLWQVSDTLALTGMDVYDFDLNQQAMSGGGILIRHSPEFSSYVDAHYINSQDQTIIGTGAQYKLTSKYQWTGGATFDAEREGFQGATMDLRRQFESITLGVSVNYDEINGTTSFGFSILPTGARSGAGIGGFGGSGMSSRVGG